MTATIAAFDLSLTGTGYCLPDGSTGRLVPAAGMVGPQRLAWLASRVMALARGTQSKAARLVVLEGYAFARANQAHQLGELGGVVRVSLWQQGIAYVEIAPSVLKRYATGKGNASKDLVLSAASHRAGRMFETGDEADAWWLWALARDASGDPVIEMPQAHRDVLAKVSLKAAA